MANAVRRRIDNVILEDVRIGFRNFEGKEGKFNAAGQRNFTIFLDPETAEAMRQDGWNIKQLQPRDDEDKPQDILRVKVNYNNSPPRVVLITSKGKTPLDESTVHMVDWMDILTTDVTISPYHYDVNGRQGITAYLKTIYIKIQEDYLDLKYDDLPTVGVAPQQLELEEDYIEAEVIDEEPLEIGQ